MTDPDGVPAELASTERRLRRARFEPRASFGPELAGRMRRGEAPRGRPAGARWLPRVGWGLAAAGLVCLAGGAWVATAPAAGSRTIDRCCFDLDGGGTADDGVLVVARRGQRVERLRVYEDLDRSGGWTPGDLLRFDRGAAPVLSGPEAPSAVATQCCFDWDGGGADDDGLMIVRSAPDRVVMAAIYETGPNSLAPPADGWRLR